MKRAFLPWLIVGLGVLAIWLVLCWKAESDTHESAPTFQAEERESTQRGRRQVTEPQARQPGPKEVGETSRVAPMDTAAPKGAQSSYLGEEISRQRSEEMLFREREEPLAIRSTATVMRLSLQKTTRLLALAAAFREEVRLVWSREPKGEMEQKVARQKISQLRIDLTRKQMEVLGRDFGSFQRTLSDEMNRRRASQLREE